MSHTISTARESRNLAAQVAGNAAGLSDMLVFQDDMPAAENAFRYAEALVGEEGGRLIGLMFGLIPATVINGYMGAGVEAWASLRSESLAEATRLWKALKRRFDQSRESVELRRASAFIEETGSILAKHAHYADITILGWVPASERYIEEGLLEGALFNSGRPVLVVPQGWTTYGSPKNILIAWKSTPQAARAVNDALPLLQKASSVTVVIVDEGKARDALDEPAPGSAIAQHLAKKNVKVVVKQVPRLGRSSAEAVLDEARFVGAELLVAGGYGHSRFREWIFGGFTRDILDATKFPILLSH